MRTLNFSILFVYLNFNKFQSSDFRVHWNAWNSEKRTRKFGLPSILERGIISCAAEGRRLSGPAWLGEIPRWLAHLTTATYPSISRGRRESNSRPLSRESNALTTGPSSHRQHHTANISSNSVIRPNEAGSAGSPSLLCLHLKRTFGDKWHSFYGSDVLPFTHWSTKGNSYGPN